MNLVLDLGNTSGKVAVCEGNHVLELETYDRVTSREIAYFHTRYPGLRGAIISSVINDSREMIDYLCNLYPTCIELDHLTPIPLINRYLTPESLGYDRIAAAVGAHTIFPGITVLVIDAGTAITYDIVTGSGEFLGGNISPGLDIRFRALHKYTSRLPYLERPGVKPATLGTTTREAMESGVVHGILFEMNGFIDAFMAEYPELKVVLTGGDSNYFEAKLKCSIFVNQNLNLIGLNRILDHNAKDQT